MTRIDQEVARRALAFHRDAEPPVTRFLLAHMPEGGGTEQPRGGTYERTAYDPSLAPAVTDAATTEAPDSARR